MKRLLTPLRASNTVSDTSRNSMTALKQTELLCLGGLVGAGTLLMITRCNSSSDASAVLSYLFMSPSAIVAAAAAAAAVTVAALARFSGTRRRLMDRGLYQASTSRSKFVQPAAMPRHNGARAAGINVTGVPRPGLATTSSTGTRRATRHFPSRRPPPNSSQWPRVASVKLSAQLGDEIGRVYADFLATRIGGDGGAPAAGATGLGGDAIGDAVSALGNAATAGVEGSTTFAAQLLLAGAKVEDAAAVAEKAEKTGWFDQYVNLIEGGLCKLHDALAAAGSTQPWGLSIVIFVIIFKLLLLPVNLKTIESSAKMKAIQPLVKNLQDSSNAGTIDREQMAKMVQEVYKKAEVNPFGAILPPFLQIPIFIGLYRSITSLASKGLINEPFLWIPNLGGPVEQRGLDLSWIVQWNGGHPAFAATYGWHDTLAYLTLPAVLVASQKLSMKLLTPPKEDQTEKQREVTESAEKIVGFIPYMVGWFTLTAPQLLGLYYLSNNVVTTSLTLASRAYVDQRQDILGLQDMCEQATVDEEDQCTVREKELNDRAFVAQMLQSQGKFDLAEPILRDLVTDVENEKGPDDPDTARAINGLSEVLRRLGRFDEALPLAERSLEIRRKLYGTDHPMTARAINNVAMLLWEQDNDSAEAADMGMEAVRIMEVTLGEKHPIAKALRANWAT